MEEDLKKILDRLERIDHKEYSGGFEFADSASFDEMARCFEERKKMANYITNLQQQYDGAILVGKELNKENKRLRTQLNAYENPDDLTLFYMWLDEKAKDKMKKLQQENEKLKDELETTTFTAKVKQEAIDALIKRIDKAIEKLESVSIYGLRSGKTLISALINDALDILKGGSNE